VKNLLSIFVAGALAGCAVPTRLYVPTVAEKPKGEDGFRADLAECKAYEAQTRYAILFGQLSGGFIGNVTAAQSMGDSPLDTPNDVIDKCLSSRGYRVLSNGGRY
jgi:hypothetical protein